MNSVFTTQTKCAVACVLVSLAFVSQASAVLRPLSPIKPAAPSNGEVIVTGDELVFRVGKKASAASTGSGTVAKCLNRRCPLHRLHACKDVGSGDAHRPKHTGRDATRRS